MNVKTDSIIMVEVRKNDLNLWVDGIEVVPKAGEKLGIEEPNYYICIEFDNADGDEFEYLGYDEHEGEAPNYIPS